MWNNNTTTCDKNSKHHTYIDNANVNESRESIKFVEGFKTITCSFLYDDLKNMIKIICLEDL